MADKMKKQQEEAKQEAVRLQQQQQEQQEQQQKTAEEEKKPASNESDKKRETRTSARQPSAKEQPAVKESGKPDTDKSKKGRSKKSSASAKGNSTISSYFQKTANTSVTENKPTVKEALENAADEFEANPTVLGEQELVATQQPELVTGGKMRKYQLEGLEWLKTLWMNGLCGILADEMGLGKTIQAISLIAFFKEKKVSGPFMIAAPLSTVSNWVDEFAKWTPGINAVLYHGSKEDRAAIRRDHMKLKDQRSVDFPVVCTSYEICMNDRKFLSQYQWRYIVVVCSVTPPGDTLVRYRS